jgi:hypothetical protein
VNFRLWHSQSGGWLGLLFDFCAAHTRSHHAAGILHHGLVHRGHSPSSRVGHIRRVILEGCDRFCVVEIYTTIIPLTVG